MPSSSHPLPVRNPGPRSQRLLTDDIHDALVESAGKGLPLSTCAKLCRISPKALERWMEAGRRQIDDWEEYEVPLSEFGELALNIQQAQATWEATMTQRIDDASTHDPKLWVAPMTRLERSQPEHYGKRTAIHVQQKVEHVYRVVELDGDDFRLRALPSADVLDGVFIPEDTNHEISDPSD